MSSQMPWRAGCGEHAELHVTGRVHRATRTSLAGPRRRRGAVRTSGRAGPADPPRSTRIIRRRADRARRTGPVVDAAPARSRDGHGGVASSFDWGCACSRRRLAIRHRLPGPRRWRIRARSRRLSPRSSRGHRYRAQSRAARRPRRSGPARPAGTPAARSGRLAAVRSPCTGSWLITITLISPRYPESIVPGEFTNDIPARAASPDRGWTNAAYPSGRAIATPVGTTARSPGAKPNVDRRDDVGAGIAGERVARERRRRVESADEYLQLGFGCHGPQGYPRWYARRVRRRPRHGAPASRARRLGLSRAAADAVVVVPGRRSPSR